MPLGIYKPEQGYWVRILTAVFAGVLVLSAGAWAFSQLQAVRAPTTGWQANLVAVQGEVEPGQTVDLLVEGEGDAFEVVGSALVDRAQPSSLRLSDPRMEREGTTVMQTQRIRLDEQEAFSAEVVNVRTVAAFQTLYLQTAVAGVIAVIGLAVVYWFVGAHRRFSEFLIAVDGEMKKVNWSSRREIIGSTWVVVGASFLIAAILFVIDYGFQSIMRYFDVLQG